MRRTVWVAVVALVTGLLAGAPPAHAAGPVVFGGPGSYLAGTYTTPVVAVPVGGELTYVHADIQGHDVVAYGVYGPDAEPWCDGRLDQHPIGQCPLFWSELIFFGHLPTPVLGLQNVEAGKTYPFYCTIHAGMRGTLVALPRSPY